jgi:hypothetical protein
MTQELGLKAERPTEPRGFGADLVQWWLQGPLGWTTVPAAIAGGLFLFDWGGYRGKFEPWGDPRSLADVWWHFPLMFAAVATVIKLIYRSTDS